MDAQGLNYAYPQLNEANFTTYLDLPIWKRPVTAASSTVHAKLLRTYKLVAETIRSMLVVSGGLLNTGSDMGVVRVLHEGFEIRNFRSTILGGPVNVIPLAVPGVNSVFLFLADNGVPRAWKRRRDNLRGVLQNWYIHIKNQVLKKNEPDGYEIFCVCASDDGSLLYSGSPDGTLITCRFTTNGNNLGCKFLKAAQAHRGPLNALCAGPGVVFTGGVDGVVVLWRRELYGRNQHKVRHVEVSRFVVQNEQNPTAVNSVLFDNSGLYAGCGDGKIRCWKGLNLDNPGVDASLSEMMIQAAGGSIDNAAVISLAASGHLLFSGLENGRICIWKRENVSEIHQIVVVLQAHEQRVNCLAAQNGWGAEEENQAWILYSSSSDGMLKIWRVSHEEEVEEELLEEAQNLTI